MLQPEPNRVRCVFSSLGNPASRASSAHRDPRRAFPATRFAPFKGFSSSTAGTRHRAPLPSCRFRHPISRSTSEASKDPPEGGSRHRYRRSQVNRPKMHQPLHDQPAGRHSPGPKPWLLEKITRAPTSSDPKVTAHQSSNYAQEDSGRRLSVAPAFRPKPEPGRRGGKIQNRIRGCIQSLARSSPTNESHLHQSLGCYRRPAFLTRHDRKGQVLSKTPVHSRGPEMSRSSFAVGAKPTETAEAAKNQRKTAGQCLCGSTETEDWLGPPPK